MDQLYKQGQINDLVFIDPCCIRLKEILSEFFNLKPSDVPMINEFYKKHLTPDGKKLFIKTYGFDYYNLPADFRAFIYPMIVKFSRNSEKFNTTFVSKKEAEVFVENAVNETDEFSISFIFHVILGAEQRKVVQENISKYRKRNNLPSGKVANTITKKSYDHLLSLAGGEGLEQTLEKIASEEICNENKPVYWVPLPELDKNILNKIKKKAESKGMTLSEFILHL